LENNKTLDLRECNIVAMAKWSKTPYSPNGKMTVFGGIFELNSSIDKFIGTFDKKDTVNFKKNHFLLNDSIILYVHMKIVLLLPKLTFKVVCSISNHASNLSPRITKKLIWHTK